MRNKGLKTRCTKQSLPKFEGVCKTFDELQAAAAVYLSELEDIETIRSNVDSALVDGTQYTSDFVCEKRNGDIVVLECVYRKYLTKPLTVKLLDASRSFWLSRGVTDWRLIVDEAAE